MEIEKSYAAIASRAIAATEVQRLLAASPRGTIVLERIARGAGATRWFAIPGVERLGDLSARLSPGSSVSFYFDDRLAAAPYGPDVVAEIVRVAARDGDAVVGTLPAGEIELDVEFVASPAELDEYAEDLLAGAIVIYGAFPARDNDGESAVTLDLPDRDGVVRPHPH